MSATVMRSVSSGSERSISLFWLSVFAALVIACLLFAFQQVVHSAVQKAHSQRIAESAEAESAWRCKYQVARTERNACLAGLAVHKGMGRDAPAPVDRTLAAAALGRP